MAEPTPGVPTLHAMSTPILTRPGDVATYLIRFLFANPGATSSRNEDEMLSFRKYMSQYQNDANGLANKISSNLTAAMRRYFPNASYEAVCTVENKEGIGDDGTYQGNRAITISIADKDGVSIIPITNIVVDSTGKAEFSTKYAGGTSR